MTREKGILDHPLIEQRYFFPRKETFESATFVQCSGAVLACFFFQPHPGAKTLVHFHGNGETVSDYLDPAYLQSISELGLNCFFAEYRGYGSSTGNPCLQSMLEDVNPIIEYLGLPREKLIVFGRSVGSLFALRAIREFPDIGGLILESGIAFPFERLSLRVRPAELGLSESEMKKEIKKQMNHAKILSTYRGPVLVMHAKFDGLIPVYHAESMAKSAQNLHSLHIFEQGDHNSLLFANYPEYMNVIKGFIAVLDS